MSTSPHQQRGTRVVKSTVEGRRIRQLEAEVQELQAALKKNRRRMPGSAAGGGRVMEAVLEEQVSRLEEQLVKREEECAGSIRTLQDKYCTMEVCVCVCVCVCV